jgi:phytoene desaturase
MAADVLVIGAGLGGLSAAIRLAGRGRKVLVLERSATVGGKVAEVTEGGFRWDAGPSVLTMRPVLEELFSAAGRRMEDYLDLQPVDPVTRYFYPDGRVLDLYRDSSRTLEEVEHFAPGEAAGFRAFLDHAARLDRITAPVFTYGPPPGLSSASQVSFWDALYAASSALRSLDAEIRRYVRAPGLRQLFGRFATYLGSSPYRAGGVLAVVAHAELGQGVWYPRRGVRSIARALEQLAGELGVEIRTGVEIERIACSHETREDYRVTGAVAASGEHFAAPVVVADVDVASVYEQLLPPGRRIRRRLAALERMEPSCSAFVLLLGVEGRYPQLVHHDVFFSRDYRREFEQIFRQGVPPDEPTIYVSVTCKVDGQDAPAECENWFVMVNVPAISRRYDWGASREAYAELVLHRLADFGLDVRGRLRVRRVITPPDLERLGGARRGSLYGTSFNDRLAPFRRPGNRCAEVQGLYFVGGTTHPGGGIPMVILSGKVVAAMLSGVE